MGWRKHVLQRELGLPSYHAKPNESSRTAGDFVEAHRWRRTGFTGAQLPGSQMLAPPPLRRYEKGSSDVR
jgi:hypothetical protein